MMGFGMKKRLLACISILVISPLLVFGGLSATYDGWEGHPRIGAGLVPTSLGAGLSFDWQSGTSIYGKGMVGYFERMIWQDPTTGNLLDTNPLVYDQLRFAAEGGLAQQLGSHMLSIGYRISYELPFDSMVVGRVLESGVVTPVAGFASSPIFGPLDSVNGTLEARYRFDRYLDNRAKSDGFLLDLRGSYGINRYLSILAEAKGAKTLLAQMEGERNLFSLVVIDRIVASYDTGTQIPLSAQEKSAFGSKIRGFSTLQYPVALSVANQFDLRLNGPSVIHSAIFPRMTLFCDVGYGYGMMANSNYSSKGGMLASSGISLNFTLGPYMDLGYQMAYLLVGENLAHPGVKMVGELVAHLRF